MAMNGKVAATNKDMREAVGSSAIAGLAPGTAMAVDVHLENLGQIADFPELEGSDDPAEGSGEYCVVLADFFSGVGPEDYFTRGDVRRLSRLVPGYADVSVSRDLVKGRIRRYLEIKAFRLASSEEQGKGHVEVTLDTETHSVVAERNRRIEAENENNRLRRQLEAAQAGQIDATPAQAGASEQAQTEVGKQTNDDGTDWES